MILQLEKISKSFTGVQVLHEIDIDVKSGEVHVLLGENGAGKSTIIKTITGAYTKDSGKILWKGKELIVSKPSDSIDVGIGTIYQELNLVPELSLMENIFLGNEKRTKGLFLDRETMRKEAKKLMERLGQKVDPDTLVQDLGVGQQQLVEIAKALSLNCELIIMDEPTSSLSGGEAEQLLLTVERLKKQGITIIYISHRLEEIKRISDRVTVLRDGYKIKTVVTNETSIDQMISLMVGRDLDNKFPKHNTVKGDEILKVKDLKLTEDKPAINFTAYKGEILGISGLVGAGRTELARAIFGADPIVSGEIYINKKKQNIKSPIDAIKAGLAFITEDRKQEGLFLDQSVIFNNCIAKINKVKEKGLIKTKLLKDVANKYVKDLRVRPNNIELETKYLSGGNQQKIVIAKWLFTDADIYIFDEPTRGIDVGAKVEVYNLMNDLVESGAGVIVISSELPEVLGVSDRILVMCEGRLTAELDISEANQENIMKAATGGL